MNGDGFYVGYLALPRRHRVFLAVTVPLAVAGMLVGAVGFALDQTSGGAAWGDGFWEAGEAREFRGTLAIEPYPMLHVEGGDEVETYLLVEMGKFGSADRFADMGTLGGAAVSVRGRELRRDGRRMIEIDPDSPSGPAVSVLASDKPAVRVVAEMGEPSEFEGEIVDSKCYLGAMKPGAGRGHRACATLCISGGIPPVLVVRDGSGGVSYLLLTDSAGHGLKGSDLERIKPMIAERITLRGQPGRLGSWSVLGIDIGQFE